MREPAATVIDPAFTSPTMTPPSSTSTRFADSMLPCNSPPTTTTAASTWPVKWAPGSMLKFPSMRTSPLKRPAMRTLPDPSILPSMVRLAAITDSPAASRETGAGAARRGAAANATSLELTERSGSGAGAGAGADARLPAGDGVIGSFRGCRRR